MSKIFNENTKDIKFAASLMGKKGGKVKSEKKRQANIENAKKPRPNRRSKKSTTNGD